MMISNHYTEFSSQAALDRALACARGVYQRNLLTGAEAWSGATFIGRARSYGYWYARSRKNLLGRIQAAGLKIERTVRAHGKIVHVISE